MNCKLVCYRLSGPPHFSKAVQKRRLDPSPGKIPEQARLLGHQMAKSSRQASLYQIIPLQPPYIPELAPPYSPRNPPQNGEYHKAILLEGGKE